MNAGFNYYRIKMMWKGELEDGSLEKIKTEDLVYASSYTEAEKIAYAIIEDQNREKHEPVYSLEIIKTKICDMLCNDTLDHDNRLVGGLTYNFFPTIENGEGFYGVKVLIISVDEKTAKEKKTYETIYTPAQSNTEAAQRVLKYLTGADAIVRDVKFDKAESILWPIDIFKSKSEAFA